MFRDDYSMKFPEDFLIGTANSAFQSEGAYDRDGKTMSMMDHFAREYAGQFLPGIAKKGRVMTNELPDDGCFFYDNYEEYIEDMKKTGQNTYRLSLAWPRIIPNGVGEVNQKGIDFYNKVIAPLNLLFHKNQKFNDPVIRLDIAKYILTHYKEQLNKESVKCGKRTVQTIACGCTR